jgi:hypothetical protein
MSLAVMTVVELADWSLGVGTVVGLTTTAWVEAEVVGLDGGAVVTETDGTVICGSATPFAGAAPEVDDGFAGAFDVRAIFGLGFGTGVVWAVAV